MAHITSQTATQAQSPAEPSESSLELEDSDTSKEGTRSDKSVSESVSTMSPNSFMADEKPDHIEGAGDSASASLEDTSCGVKNKRMNRSRKGNNAVRDSRSECRAIKGGAGEDSAVSPVLAEREGSCVTLNLASNMERVNPDLFAFGRSGSPYPSSENEWEASDDDHSDTDADHSDSSDDDNPTSQVDRMIECGARLIMDGENSNLSSETDDTDDDDGDFQDDSDSDITDVSPLVSTTGSPLGLSPVMSRRNLPSSISSKPPFMRHYSHRGHDGDVEDEEEEEQHDFPHWTTDDLYASHDNTNLNPDSANMSMVVQALIKIRLESRKNVKDSENLDSVNENDNSHPHVIRNRHSHVSSALQANPHHRHLRKGGNHSRRKNMSFTNEEVRIINRDNTIMLEKLLAVSNRPEKTSATTHTNPNFRQGSKPASASVNRRHQEEGIKKDNLAILRRLQEVKPSRGVAVSRYSGNSFNPTTTSSRHHHHSHHHHHKSHQHSSHHHHHSAHHHKSPAQYSSSAATSCSATARQSAFSPPHHHSPKETAL